MAMIQCPECGKEISNLANACPHCGCPVTPAQTGEDAQAASRKKLSPAMKILIIVAVVILLLAGAYFGCYAGVKNNAQAGNLEAADKLLFLPSVTELHDAKLVAYVEAGSLMTQEDYAQAYTAFSAMGEYLDASALALECRYNQALQLADSQKYEEALKIMTSLSEEEYSDAAAQLQHIRYRQAMDLMNKEDYLAGCPILAELREEEYAPAADSLTSMAADIYQQAQEFYREGNYDNAGILFSCNAGYENSSQYLTLINAHYVYGYNEGIDAWKQLRSLFYFEDTQQIVLTNEDIFQAFMMGVWQAEGYFYDFIMQPDLSISTYLPWVEWGDYYRIEDGVFLLYPASNYDNTKELFTIRIITPDCIEFFCHKNGINYTMHRTT